MSIFETLNAINVNDKTEKKNGLTYLSWAWAWGEVKKLYPEANFTIYERQTDFGAVNYYTDGRTCWVKTGLTINGLEHIEELPVMDFRNNAIPLDKVTSTDVNKAIQRSLTKAAARHGLGLYIYAGEDLPECEADKQEKPEPKPIVKPVKQDAPAKVEVTKKIPPANPVQAYLNNEIAFMSQRLEISDRKEMADKFAEMRKSLIAGGVIPDIKSDEMTMEQAKQMIEAMYDNFFSDGDQKWSVS